MNDAVQNAASSKIKDDIIAILNQLVPESEIEFRVSVNNGDLSALGLNSLTYVELIVSIEQKYGFEFEDEMLSLEAINNLNTLITYIISRM